MVSTTDNISNQMEIDDFLNLQKEYEKIILENYHLKQEIEDKDKTIEELVAVRDKIYKDAFRTIDLNNKLADSEEELKNLNAQKDKFFSIIAHDLRNPIGNFKELTSVLSSSIDTISKEDRIEFIDDLAQSSKQLFSLLENLLEWSRSQTGRIPYVPTNSNLSFLCDNSISLLEMSANNKNIELISFVPNDVIVYVDSNMIYTVIRNLISNAIKFTPDMGMIKLETSIAEDFVELIISDTGVGIEKGNIYKLFRIDEFTSTAGTNQEKGTGLGLVLCKEFVEKNNGSIRVESEVGKGSKFIISLPRESKDEEMPQEYVSIKSSKSKVLKSKKAKYIIDKELIPIDTLRKLPELLIELENKFQSLYLEAEETQLIGTISEFSDKIQVFAVDNEIYILKNFSSKLKNYTEDLEIDKMNKLLSDYPKIIDVLKNI